MPYLHTSFDLALLQHEVKIAAHRLLHQLRLPGEDLADLRQEFLVDLIARLPSFDPKRGSLGAFVGTIIAHRATRVARKVRNYRRMFGVVPVSLDEILPDSENATRGDLIPEAAGYGSLFGQQTDRIAEAELRLNFESGLSTLSDSNKELCASLAYATVDELATRGRGARSSLYRRVERIRLELMSAGVTPARNS